MRFTFEFIQNLKFILFAVSSSVDSSRSVMIRLPSPSSRSSLESMFPLDLASGLTARLQAASFQPSALDCAVLPNLIVWGPVSLLLFFQCLRRGYGHLLKESLWGLTTTVITFD